VLLRHLNGLIHVWPSRNLLKRPTSGETLGSKSGKSKNHVRNVLGHGVQVMATPMVNRRKDMYPDLPLPRPTHDTRGPDEPDVIPPSIPRIHSSSIKLPPVPTLHFSPPEDIIPTPIPRPYQQSPSSLPIRSLRVHHPIAPPSTPGLHLSVTQMTSFLFPMTLPPYHLTTSI
jgi:hypothetical protein